MRILGNLVLKLMGWKIVGSIPQDKKFIFIVAPHTSNWDFIIGLMARFSLGIKVSFLAKKQLFTFPLGTFLRFVGGISVDRTKSAHLVDQIVALFNQSQSLYLAITPEGTRKPVTRWKQGFYHIACQAHIPIVMVGFDYAAKKIIIADGFKPSGDIAKDFTHIVGFFRNINGCYPKEIPDYQAK